MAKLTKKNIKDLRFDYLNQLINISKLQHDVVTMLHGECLSQSIVASRLHISLDRVRHEEAAAFKTMFFIAIGDTDQVFFDTRPAPDRHQAATKTKSEATGKK